MIVLIIPYVRLLALSFHSPSSSSSSSPLSPSNFSLLLLLQVLPLHLNCSLRRQKISSFDSPSFFPPVCCNRRQLQLIPVHFAPFFPSFCFFLPPFPLSLSPFLERKDGYLSCSHFLRTDLTRLNSTQLTEFLFCFKLCFTCLQETFKRFLVRKNVSLSLSLSLSFSFSSRSQLNSLQLHMLFRLLFL